MDKAEGRIGLNHQDLPNGVGVELQRNRYYVQLTRHKEKPRENHKR